MPKVILFGSPTCQWDIDGKMKPGGTEIDLTTKQISDNKKVIEHYIDKPVKKPVAEPSIKTVTTKATYTEKQLFAMNKDEQLAILEKLEIKPASREAERVEQILEASK